MASERKGTMDTPALSRLTLNQEVLYSAEIREAGGTRQSPLTVQTPETFTTGEAVGPYGPLA